MYEPAKLNYLCVCLAILSALPVLAQERAGGRVIDSAQHHLGDEVKRDWPEAVAKPEGVRLQLRFTANANPGEVVIGILQRDLSDPWTLDINGTKVAELKRSPEVREFFYPVPAGVLKDGENTLSIDSRNSRDDIVVGPIRVFDQTLREFLRLERVTVTVSDGRNSKPVPARITITDPLDRPVELFNVEGTHIAVRQGILYMRGTKTTLELPEGDYLFYATRGTEWSRDRKSLSLRQKKPAQLGLKVRRELDTSNFIAADTHVHTLTFSGHGDASVEERMITLAAEGVELAVATDHNHNTDYAPCQQKLELNEFFTAVTGNEVTTPIGHMNAFPLDPRESPPDHNLGSWVQLVNDMRGKGAKIIILNHPRWPTVATSPLTKYGLNRASGDFSDGRDFPFDAMEVANALAPQPDPLYLFRDWFALLNHGEKITAIGSSDSHTVGDPVGQGRSYVPSATDEPAKIDVDDACERFLAGETSISLGIFADVRVDGRFTMGHTYTPAKRSLDVRLRVASPSWVQPRRAIVFLNGKPIAEKPVSSRAGRATDVWVRFSVPVPAHDAYLVCVVLGDGVDHPSWRTDEKFTLAATNPIYLDVDRDGKYRSPRETAQELLSRAGDNMDRQWDAAMHADDVIAVQMVSLMRHLATGGEREELDKRLRETANQRPLFQEYVRYALPELKAESGNAQ